MSAYLPHMGRPVAQICLKPSQAASVPFVHSTCRKSGLASRSNPLRWIRAPVSSSASSNSPWSSCGAGTILLQLSSRSGDWIFATELPMPPMYNLR